jgi:antitoxin YefM
MTVALWKAFAKTRCLSRSEWHSHRMNAISYAEARGKLADVMNRTCEDHNPVIITRHRKQAVVLLSLEDYSSMEETAYLNRSPANARRLREAIAGHVSRGVSRFSKVSS